VTPQGLCDLVVTALDDLKGREVAALDVTGLTDLADFMVIATGGSNRHVQALVDQVVDAARSSGASLLGIEGRESHEWVLVDLGDVVVHVMQAATREFYDVERLWRPLPIDTDSTL